MIRIFMKVTVCEVPDNWTESDHQWQSLLNHLQDEESDLILLPEMPFLSLEIDLKDAEKAKTTYPRYVLD